MSGKIKQPVQHGRVKVPVVMQMEALECGAAALTMIMAYYGKWIPLEQVRVDCGVSRDGSNARNILKAARSYGMTAGGFRYEPEELREKGTFPCIVHWNFNHFVVCCGFKGKYAYLNDPARGTVKVTMDEFDRAFTGICIQFEPSETFVPSGKKKSILDFAAARLRGAGPAVAFVILTTMISYLFGIINPVFTRFFMDRLLTGENRDLLTPFILLLAGVDLLQIVVSAAQTIYSLKISGKMSVIGSSTYMWKVLKMPMDFFSQRMAGDVQSRLSTNATIAETLVNTLTPLGLNAVMMFFYLGIMINYSPFLTLIGISALVFSSFAAGMISSKRVNITRVQSRDEGKLAATTVNGIQMIETIKASGAENGYFTKWAGYQASVNAQTVKFARLESILGMLPSFISLLADNAVLIFGVYMAIRGKFTLGMIMVFQTFLSSFMSPAMTMVSAGQMIQEMRTDMERVEDVMSYPDDPCYSDEALSEEKDYSKLSGSVELKNVTFGYSKLSDPLIRDFSMSIRPGGRVAFVGMSGCGKSTLTGAERSSLTERRSPRSTAVFSPAPLLSWTRISSFSKIRSPTISGCGTIRSKISRSSWLPEMPRSTTISCRDRMAMRGRSSREAGICPAARDRDWRSPAFSLRIPRSSSWTKRQAPSMPRQNMNWSVLSRKGVSPAS